VPRFERHVFSCSQGSTIRACSTEPATSVRIRGPRITGARPVQVDRDVSSCAFLFHDNVILCAIYDRLHFGHHMALCDDEARRIRPNVLILGGGHHDPVRAHGIRALAQEVIRCVFLAEGVGDFTDPFVHVPEKRLVQRKAFLLCLLHWAILAHVASDGRRAALHGQVPGSLEPCGLRSGASRSVPLRRVRGTLSGVTRGGSR
jgi:hypothetical protein